MHTCEMKRAYTCTQFKRTSASAPVPSAGLTSRKPLRLFPPGAGSRRPPRRNQPTPRRGKRLGATPTSVPNLKDSGECNIFHRLWRWKPWNGKDARCKSSWLAGLFQQKCCSHLEDSAAAHPHHSPDAPPDMTLPTPCGAQGENA